MPTRHIALPNEHWVEVRENLQGRDKTAVQSILKIKVRTTEQVDEVQRQTQEIGADLQARMQDVLLANIITAWSYPVPIPSELGGADAVGALDIDEWEELHAKTVDLMEKVSFKVPNREEPNSGSSRSS